MTVCRWLFAYGLIHAFFQIMPTFIPGQFAGPVSGGEAFDFLTPLAVVPVALAAFLSLRKTAETAVLGSRRSSKWPLAVLVLGLICYVEGHGLHLSANAIDRLLGAQENTALHQSVYIYDEVISHFIWDSGVLIIAAGLIMAGAKVSFPRLSWVHWTLLGVGAVFFGFSYAVNAIEGQTVVLTLPAAVVMGLICLRVYGEGRRRREYNPAAFFFLMGFLLSVLLFAYWGIAHQGFPGSASSAGSEPAPIVFFWQGIQTSVFNSSGLSSSGFMS
jgi:hypothetical protein